MFYFSEFSSSRNQECYKAYFFDIDKVLIKENMIYMKLPSREEENFYLQTWLICNLWYMLIVSYFIIKIE